MSGLPKLALSINQPWAWLIAAGHKDVENRNWNTEFRGEFLIHAGKTLDKGALADLDVGEHPVTGEDFRPWEGGLPRIDTGGMVGIAELVGVVTKRTGGADNPWFVGRYGFVIRNARPIELIPCVGALGFFAPNYALAYAPKPEPKPRTVRATAAANFVAPQPDLFA